MKMQFETPEPNLLVMSDARQEEVTKILTDAAYNPLTEEELDEMRKYIILADHYGYTNQIAVNRHIDKGGMWDQFPTIRAHNSYTNPYTQTTVTGVPGISGKHYKLLCSVFNMNGRTGAELIESNHY